MSNQLPTKDFSCRLFDSKINLVILAVFSWMPAIVVNLAVNLAFFGTLRYALFSYNPRLVWTLIVAGGLIFFCNSVVLKYGNSAALGSIRRRRFYGNMSSLFLFGIGVNLNVLLLTSIPFKLVNNSGAHSTMLFMFTLSTVLAWLASILIWYRTRSIPVSLTLSIMTSISAGLGQLLVWAHGFAT